MRITSLGFAVLLALASGVASSAGTISATLPLDTGTSHLDASLTLNGHTIASAAIGFKGGFFSADIEQTGSGPPALSLSNVSGQVDASDFLIHTLLGNLSAKGLSLSAGPSAGPFPTDGADPAQVNLAGLTVSLDEGTIGVGNFLIANFSKTPLHFTLPTTFATLNDTILSLQIPVDVSASKNVNILKHQATLAVTITGSINFAGSIEVPEPSSFALAGLGTSLLLAAGRRRARRR